MAKKNKRQLSFFTDNQAARIERDKAILQAESAARKDWLGGAYAVLQSVARKHLEFTSEDLWKAGLELPREPRALGSVFAMMAKKGIIRRSGRYIQSSRKSRHCAPITVWISNICTWNPEK